jgi:hypothetical protein
MRQQNGLLANFSFEIAALLDPGSQNKVEAGAINQSQTPYK